VFDYWINAGVDEECFSSTSCVALKTDMFVSCEQPRESMMTSFIFPTAHLWGYSQKLHESFCFSKCDSQKEPPLTLCWTDLRSRSLSKVPTITRPAGIKHDEEGSRFDPSPKATWVTLAKQPTLMFLYVLYPFQSVRMKPVLCGLLEKQLSWWCFNRLYGSISFGNLGLVTLSFWHTWSLADTKIWQTTHNKCTY